ncbi:MAG: hypothetical protein HYX69_13515 [Planctomycetia bacterium]|nr:hypothetical protein [Planctomycetia bacterium]
MRFLSAVIGLLLASAAIAAGADPAPAPKETPPIFTRQTTFTIPYRMDQPEAGARRPVEVQLHVSENGGPWKLYGKVPPERKSFTFRSHGDGKYAFMVRTKDDHGDLQPAAPPRQELVVILDTDPPVLELVAELGSAGEVHARWRATDPHLLPGSLKVEYQLNPNSGWMPVAIDLPYGGNTGSNGQATWVLPARATALSVRAEIRDAAGNVAKGQKQVELPAGMARAAADGGSATWRPPGAATDKTPTPGGAVWPGERTDGTPLDPSAAPPAMTGRFPLPPGRSRAASARTDPEVVAPGRPRAAPAEEVAPAERVRAQAEQVMPRESLAQEELPPPARSAPRAQPSSERRVAAASQPEELDLPTTTRDPRQRAPRTRRELEAANDGPRLPLLTAAPPDDDLVPRGEGDPRPGGAASTMSAESLPSDARPRLVNSRRFELDYDIEAVGPAGVGKVEVWGTPDGGRAWSSYGVDSDNRSPFAVNVSGEGLYGFRVVVESGAGLRGERPKEGDKPDVWVEVDTTKPVARLTKAELGTGPHAGELSITWEASDEQLAERPISLFLSPYPDGPWSTMAAELENTGQYTWRLDNRAPGRVYLRLEARDEAGNIQVVDSVEPVPLDPVRPKGRIRAVRPVSNTPSAGRMRNPFYK